MARRRSPVPWLYALALLLTVLCPFLFVGVWVADGTVEGFGPALLTALADLAAAVVAAVTATVLAAQRGVRRVRTVVLGHPDGRAGRVAEHQAARWALARERFTGLQREYAAFEADPRAVSARPALTDVTVPATARFVDAYADAEYLATDAEPAGPRREEFAAAVDRAVAAWHEAGRVAEALAAHATVPVSRPAPRHTPAPEAPAAPGTAGHARTVRSPAAHAPAAHGTAAPPRAVEPPRVAPGPVGGRAPEYGEAAQAVRRAAARGARDLRDRLRA